MQIAPREHSAIHLTCINLQFVFETLVLPIFEWLLQTGFTVYMYCDFTESLLILNGIGVTVKKSTVWGTDSRYFDLSHIQDIVIIEAVSMVSNIIGVAPITQLRMFVIKIVTAKGGHLMIFYTKRNCS